MTHVADSTDLTVGDMPQRSRDISQSGRPHPQTLHYTGRLAHIDHIAHPVLVFGQHEDPRQDVFDQILGPESKGNTHYPGSGH